MNEGTPGLDEGMMGWALKKMTRSIACLRRIRQLAEQAGESRRRSDAAIP